MSNAILLPAPVCPVNCNADPNREARSASIRALEASYEAKRQARLATPLYPVADAGVEVTK